MLKMIEGASINISDKLNEEFEVYDGIITANVSKDKILKVLMDYVDIESEPLFLIIEVPTSIRYEKIDGDLTSNFHRDVYYTNPLSCDDINDILSEIGDLFVDDGLSQIGVGNIRTKSEIMTDKYNIVYIYTGNEGSNKYVQMFTKNSIKEVKSLVTAWDFFSEENPGESRVIKKDGKTVYDAVEVLKKKIGLYFVERREE